MGGGGVLIVSVTKLLLKTRKTKYSKFVIWENQTKLFSNQAFRALQTFKIQITGEPDVHGGLFNKGTLFIICSN